MRSGICILDSAGTLYEAFDGCGVAPWTYQGFTYVSIEDIKHSGPDTLYICGAYVGFDDCTINDPNQRFVSRLLVSEITTAMEDPVAQTMRLYPNPASVATTLEVAHVPLNTTVLLRDALGRVALELRLRSHSTTMDLRPLADGIYTVELTGNGQRLATQRLVVQQ